MRLAIDTLGVFAHFCVTINENMAQFILRLMQKAFLQVRIFRPEVVFYVVD